MCLSYFAVVHCMKILSLAINHCFFRTAAPAPLCRSLHRRRKLWCFYSLHKINHEYHKLIHSVSARLYSNWTWTHRLSAKKQEEFFCRESSVMNGNDKSQCVRVYVCQNKMCKSHVILSITAFYVYFFFLVCRYNHKNITATTKTTLASKRWKNWVRNIWFTSILAYFLPLSSLQLFFV